jgi:hypothetical protein
MAPTVFPPKMEPPVGPIIYRSLLKVYQVFPEVRGCPGGQDTPLLFLALSVWSRRPPNARTIDTRVFRMLVPEF